MNNRISYLDRLRVFALFLVLYTHSCAQYYSIAPKNMEGLISILLLPVSQCCVTLFFMISGALLLKKEETPFYVLKHRFLPFLILTAVMVTIQYVFEILTHGYSFSAHTYVKFLYSGNIINQYWFLYAYLGFLLLLPFMQKLVKVINDEYYKYLFFIMLVLFMLTNIISEAGFTANQGLTSQLTDWNIFFPLAGYYLENVNTEIMNKKKNRVLAILIFAFSLILNFILVDFTFLYYGSARFTYTLCPLLSCLIFLIFRHYFNGSGTAPVASFLGGCVFTTYLFEVQIRYLIQPLINRAVFCKMPYLAELCLLPLIFIIGILLASVLKLIPGIKKYI